MSNTNRRVWLKQIITVGSAILLLPGCVNDENVQALNLEKLNINDSDENLLAEIGETIIPETGTPGSKALNLHQFVLKMIDDCYEPKEQILFVQGLQNMHDYIKTVTGMPFSEQDPNTRTNTLIDITAGTKVPADIAFFFRETKILIIKGFQTSEYVLTKLLPYELVPGRFHGCVKTFPAF